MGRILQLCLLLRIWLQVAITLATAIAFTGVLLGLKSSEKLWAFAVAATVATGLIPLWRRLRRTPEEWKLLEWKKAQAEGELEEASPVPRVLSQAGVATVLAGLACVVLHIASVGKEGCPRGDDLPLFAQRERYVATNHGVKTEISRARYLTIRLSQWAIGASFVLSANLLILRDLLVDRRRACDALASGRPP